jgi:glycosyltransferase involved in cell wall biosynthesis
MNITILTDAWYPQVNGVVRTLDNTRKELENLGHRVTMITPDDFWIKFPLPTYSEIKVSVDVWGIGKKILRSSPDAIHIATEGTIGLAGRMFCASRKIPYTTSYHTKFPEYAHNRIPMISEETVYKYVRWFHSASEAVLVTTASMKEELESHGFTVPIIVWNRGVDIEAFNPIYRYNTEEDTIKTLLYVGRISVEKNLEEFLSHNIPNTRTVVVGDGPDRKKLQSKYPYAHWLGVMSGEDLSYQYANADVFVFPSKTDTFGLVMLEANACGTPVAAFPVTGPKDYIVNGINGHTNPHLNVAILNALQVNRNNCHEYVKANYSWKSCAETFASVLVDAK